METMTTRSGDIREIRVNPVVPSESVLVATARAMRPKKKEEAPQRDARERVETCPFCRGNESMTPPAVKAWPEAPDWDIRVVENLYPVLGDDREHPNLAFGLHQTIDGYGRHEVIVDHASHGIRFCEMSEAHIALLFSVYRERMEQLYRANRRLRYVLVFKNYGPAAGASIAHTHSQIIALPVVPDNVQAEVRNSRSYYQRAHRCVFCGMIDEALTFETTIYDRQSGAVSRRINAGQFVVERGERFIAIKPFASRFEWEVMILPLAHAGDFTTTAAGEFHDLARVMRRTMARINALVGGVQYNFFLHSLPRDPESADCHASYHWHVEICPRTSIPTGFELGSGLFVNTLSPEEAAEKLRGVELPD